MADQEENYYTGFIHMEDCPDCYGTGISKDKGICGTCKGERKIPSNDAQKILKAQDYCAKYKENPIILLAIPIAIITTIALTTKPIWDMAYVDVLLVFALSYISTPKVIMLVAIIVLIKFCRHVFRGSTNRSDRKFFRAIGEITIVLAILTAIIAGPIRSDGFDWIERETIIELNKNLACTESPICYEVEFSRRLHNTYFGKAKCANDQTLDIIAKYKSYTADYGKYRHYAHAITVEYQNQ